MSSTSSTASSASGSVSASAGNLSGALAGFDLPPPPCRSSIEDLRVAQLHAELDSRGLDAGGRKAELVGRLLRARQEEWNVSLCRAIRREVEAAAFRRREGTAVAGSQDDGSQDDGSQEGEQLDAEQEEGDDLSTESDRSHQENLREIQRMILPGQGQPGGGNNSNDDSDDDDSLLLVDQMMQRVERIYDECAREDAGGSYAVRVRALQDAAIAEAVERRTLPLRREIDSLKQQYAQDVADLRAENAVLAEDVFRLRAQLSRLQGEGEASGNGGEGGEKKEEADDDEKKE